MITAAVLGASGYSGAELVRLLASRDDVALTHLVASSSAGKSVPDLYPSLAGTVDASYEPYDPATLAGSDIVFLALPSGEAMNIVPELSGSVGRIIDLGGDFRLPSAALYQEYYGRPHAAPNLLGTTVYGLPEINERRIRDARLVANPGCYPTSALLALLPALAADLIAPEGIVVNSLSGVSGAGRSATVELSFSEVNENIRAYKIGTHQHLPEIETVLRASTGKEVNLSFIPHLVPITRGIYTTVHAKLRRPLSAAEAQEAYRSFYAAAPFVRVKKQIPQITNVVRTNYCDLFVTIEPRTQQLIIVSVIDNLVKGAAGQAIQNMNIMFALPQEQGLN
jgi:N-acetyl-gamma-glutamyl-phosphate reductase